MSHVALMMILAPLFVAPAALGLFLIYLSLRYTAFIVRVFEEKPLFSPLRLAPQVTSEEVRFQTSDGLELAGSYLARRTESRAGIVVFCHEYLSDRWSYQPYADTLRDLGFDLFSFDFRNHGESGSVPDYKPLQWVTDHEVRDLRAALSYLRSRPDHDAAGFGLIGISRGGGTALLVAADEPSVWGVITDGAFPTRGTMLAYILRWAEIYVGRPFIWRFMPLWVFGYMTWVGRLCSERRLHCKFPDLERAVARLSPRPWLMIHGARDTYIGPEIAEALYARARPHKELWIVPGAKHNRCLELQGDAYHARIVDFLRRFAPRRATQSAVLAVPSVARQRESAPSRSQRGTPVAPLSGELVTPVSG